MEILIVGNNGQLARAFHKSFKDINFSFTSLGRKQTNNDLEFIAQYIESRKVDWIVNTSAFTQVDLAEIEKEEAHKANVLLPQKLAKISAQRQIPLIHFSTDYVYPGNGNTPWMETDPTGPLNYYGMTKLEGEKEVQRYQPQHLIFRTSWLYGQMGLNFPNKIIQQAKILPQLRVVADQVGSPTYVQNVADMISQIIAQGVSPQYYGTYNICHGEYVSWYEFTEHIITEAFHHGILDRRPEIVPVSSKEFPTAAERPLNSRLNTEKLKNNFNIIMPTWLEGLKQYFAAF